MGRIRENITIDGRNYWTLFDSGSRNNYIIQGLINDSETFSYKEPQKVHLGGQAHSIKKGYLINSLIDGKEVVGIARIIDHMGNDEEGKEIEV
ncbi:MAG TPA: hypothetical protein ENI73_09505, partial [Spirochaetes bacterium]|nr:hypothetical protein [Spirochaetota bacterium]